MFRWIKKVRYGGKKRRMRKDGLQSMPIRRCRIFYEKGGECDAIICGNDDLAAQVILALSENRKQGLCLRAGW